MEISQVAAGKGGHLPGELTDTTGTAHLLYGTIDRSRPLPEWSVDIHFATLTDDMGTRSRNTCPRPQA